MKKIIIIALLFAACKSSNYEGTYVHHTEGPYSIAEDTLIIRDNIVTKRTGFQKIRNGRRSKKSYKVQRWVTTDPYAPVIQFIDGKVQLGPTTYMPLP